MRVGDEDSPFVGEPHRQYLRFNRSSLSHGDCAFDMKFTVTAMIKQAERRVAMLLDLCNHQPGANRMYRPSRHPHDITGENGSPGDEVHDRTVTDRLAQLIWSYVPAQAQRDLRARRRTQHVPSLGFASCESDCVRESVVRMDLYGKRLASEQQF
jgi:hypothetical protein